MQCHSCAKTFATVLSVCPSCGAMPTQHGKLESSLYRPLPEKITTAELKLEVGDEITMPENRVEPIEPTEETPSQSPQPSKREFTSTLIEFPKRTPAWREEIRQRVRAAQEKREQPETAAPEVKKQPVRQVEQSAPEPAMVIDLVPNLEQRPTNRLLARALERVERSRQNHQGSLGTGLATALAPVKDVEEQNSAIPNAQNESSRKPFTLLSPKTENAERSVPRKTETSASGNWYSADLPQEEQSKEPGAAKQDVAEPVLKIETTVRPEPRKISGIVSDADAEKFLESQMQIPIVVSARPRSPRAAAAVVEQEVEPRVRQAVEEEEIVDDYAPLGRRLGAGALDILLCGGIAFGIFALFAPASYLQTQNITVEQVATLAAIFAAVKFIYLTIALTLSETTLSLYLFSLRVVHAEEGTAPSFLRSAARSLVYLLVLATGGIGLVTALINPERRAFHDLISGTVVIREV